MTVYAAAEGKSMGAVEGGGGGGGGRRAIDRIRTLK